MEQLLVVKIGGNIIDNENALQSFLKAFASVTGPKILIHGGGKLATELSNKLGIETKLVEGRRITDEATIKIVTMTYAGWINKSVVTTLNAQLCKCIGLTGADANLFPAIKRPVKDTDYGWVGDIIPEKVNTPFLHTLLNDGLTPVIAPITCNETGNLLNVNADTVARTIAEALSKTYLTKLIYCFEKNGLLKDLTDDSSIIEEVNLSTAEVLKTEGIISKGMIPKIDNALGAIKNGVHSVVIGHAEHIKKLATNQKGYGTYIKA